MDSQNKQECKEALRRAFDRLASGAKHGREAALSTLKPSRYSSRSTRRLAERLYRRILATTPYDGLTHPDAAIRQDALLALALA